MNRRTDTRENRFQKILEYLRQNKYASMDDLGNLCDTSTATIRRDVELLFIEGKVLRVHGGVVYVEPPTVRDVFDLPRSADFAEEKQAIGKAAGTLVKDNETIYISSGTTTECIIPYIIERKGLTVITRSLNIVAKLMKYEHINVIMLSGQLSRAESDLAGELSDGSITELVSEKIISGAYGLNPKSGLTTSDAMHVKTGRSIIAHMGELIILADHTKFTRSGTVQLAPAADISTIITDKQVPQYIVDEFRALGVKVIQA
jgi:DeoR/GlpR family transcriptional regulator of sugar metabolism